MSHNVGDFVEMLKFEDRGIDTIFVKNAEGVRIASKTSIQTLFDQVFIHGEFSRKNQIFTVDSA